MKKLCILMPMVVMVFLLIYASGYCANQETPARSFPSSITGPLELRGDGSRLTFDNAAYIDGAASELLKFYGDDTDITFDLDTTTNSVTGPDIYSATHDDIGFLDNLHIDAKNLSLDDTTASTIGVIKKGGERWLHNYSGSGGGDGENIFIGFQSGNYTLDSDGPTWKASFNVGLGYRTLNALTQGGGNLAIGNLSLASDTTGNNNVGIGSTALQYNITGTGNIAIGENAGKCHTASTNLTAPGNGVFLGRSTKAAGATSANEIVIGANAVGHGSNTVTLGYTDITDTYLEGNIVLGDGTLICTLTVVEDDGTCTGTRFETGATASLCATCN